MTSINGGFRRRMGASAIRTFTVAAALVTTSVVGMSYAGATAGDPAPTGTTSATGAKGQTITVTPVDGLPLSGGTVEVTGTGFSHNNGFYLALCVDKGADKAPSPCVGGAATEGSVGASYWVSTNPPPFAVGLTEPLNEDGSFKLTLGISSTGEGIDCLDPNTKCVVSTRADHTQPGERGWDTKVPVTFVGQEPSIPTTTVPTPTTTPTTSTPAPQPTTPQSSIPAPTAPAPATSAPAVLAESAINQSTGTTNAAAGTKAKELAFTGSNALVVSIIAICMVLAGIAMVTRTSARAVAGADEHS